MEDGRAEGVKIPKEAYGTAPCGWQKKYAATTCKARSRWAKCARVEGRLRPHRGVRGILSSTMGKDRRGFVLPEKDGEIGENTIRSKGGSCNGDHFA